MTMIRRPNNGNTGTGQEEGNRKIPRLPKVKSQDKKIGKGRRY